MIAIILCAGFATRMYPLTENSSKPLLPVAGRPVLNYLLDQIVGLPGVQTIHIVSNAKFYKVIIAGTILGRKVGNRAKLRSRFTMTKLSTIRIGWGPRLIFSL